MLAPNIAPPPVARVAPPAAPSGAIAPFPGSVKPPAAAVKSGGKAPVALDVTGMQKLLASHGYQIPVDGVNGPLTQAAAADFRGSRNPAAFNVGHGLAHGAGPTVVPTVTTAPPTAPQVAPKKSAAPPKAKAPAPPTSKPAAPAPTAAQSDQATATSTINAIIAPLIKQITDAETQRSSQGQQLISGYTQDAMNKLKGIDFQAPFTGAAGSENAVNTALLNELQGQGSDAQNQLGATLAKAGTDPTLAAALAARVGTDTAGAAGANLAKGDATTSSLISQGADAKSYGQKLGPITSLAGAQDVSKLLGEVANDQKTQLGDISSKVPGMVQSELATLSTARTQAQKNQIAQIIAEGYDPTTGQLTPKARASLASATGYDPTTGKPTARTVVAQTNANTSATRSANSQANSDRNYQLALKRIGISQKREQTAALAAETKLKNGGFSASQVARFKGTALTLGQNVYDGFKDSKGVAHPPLDYQGAVLEGRKEGIPLSILLPAIDTFYKPGERGRPLPNSPGGAAVNAKQTALAQALWPSPLTTLTGGK